MHTDKISSCQDCGEEFIYKQRNKFGKIPAMCLNCRPRYRTESSRKSHQKWTRLYREFKQKFPDKRWVDEHLKCLAKMININNSLRERELEILDFINTQISVPIHCHICLYTWSTIPMGVINGTGCPRCNGCAPPTLEELEQIRQEALIRKIDADVFAYKGAKTKISCICLVESCGKQWKTLLYNIRNGSMCPKCSYKLRAEKLRLTYEELTSLFFMALTKKIVVDFTGYSNNEAVNPSLCLICNYEWTISVSNLRAGKGCPNCKSSSGEKIVRFILEKIFDTKFVKRKFNMYDRNLEIDCYAQINIDGNIIIIGAEVQGPQHYRPTRFGHMTPSEAEEKFKTQQEIDVLKVRFFVENGWTLIHINNEVSNRFFSEHVKLVKSILQQNNIPFKDIEITEEMYYQKLSLAA